MKLTTASNQGKMVAYSVCEFVESNTLLQIDQTNKQRCANIYKLYQQHGVIKSRFKREKGYAPGGWHSPFENCNDLYVITKKPPLLWPGPAVVAAAPRAE